MWWACAAAYLAVGVASACGFLLHERNKWGVLVDADYHIALAVAVVLWPVALVVVALMGASNLFKLLVPPQKDR